MILRINPNRMELLRLRKRLLLAQRGHKLLQGKLEQMMQKLLSLLKELDRVKEDFVQKTTSIFQNLLYCRITSSQSDFQETLTKIEPRLILDVSSQRIMNVRVPTFKIEKLTIEKKYDFFKTSAQWDLVIAFGQEFLQSLLRFAQLLKTLDILAGEIERTRRRVNALEYLLIPSIQETIRYITQKLSELERANLLRLMRVKEIVRRH